MRKFNFLSKSSSRSCGHSSVTLASTVGSPSAHRRSTMLRLLSVLVLVLTIGVGNVWGATATIQGNCWGTAAQSYQTDTRNFTDEQGNTWTATGYGVTANTAVIIGRGGANYLQTPEFSGNISSIKVTWSGNTSYYLALQTTNGTELEAKSNPSTATEATFTVSGSYKQLRLVGRRSSGTSNAAATITKVVVTYGSSCTPLTMSAVTATPGDRQIELNWPAVSNADSYTVSCVEKSSGNAAGTGTGFVNSTSCTITGLTNGTEYTWSVEPVGSGTYCSTNTPATGDETPNLYHTVTWQTHNGVFATTQVLDGQKPTFPKVADANPTSCDTGEGASTTFYGWATSTWSGKAATLEDSKLSGITIYTSAASMATVTTDDVVYYAVFCKGSAGTEVLNEAFDNSSSSDSNTKITTSTFSNFSGSTDYAYKSQYGGLKLGSGSYVGYITSKSLDLSSAFTVSIDARKYGTDDANISVTVGSTTKTISNSSFGTSEYKTCTLDFDAATSTSTVSITTVYASSKYRAYIDNVVVTRKGAASNFMTTCCTKLAQINGSVSLSQDGGDIKVDWTEGITGATGYIAKVYANNNNAKGDYTGISATVSGNAATSVIISNANLVTGVTYWVGVSPLDNTGTYCEEGAEKMATSSITLEALACVLPTFDPDGSAAYYTSAQTVTLTSATEGAAIYYTMGANPADPTSGSTLYNPSNKPVVSASTKIKAIAIKDGLQNSSVASATYTIKCVAPTISPNGATSNTGSQEVTLTSSFPTDATIYYTTNGNTPAPGEEGTFAYSAAFTITESATVKAIAVKDGLTNSEVASAVFTVNTPRTFSFDAGTGSMVAPATASMTEDYFGAGITLPAAAPSDACADEEWEFAGWKEGSNIEEQTTTAPTLLNANTSYNPETEVTLYAVYKKVETGGSVVFARYEKVTSNPEDWSGKYLLATEPDIFENAYTFTGQDGTSNSGLRAEYTPGTTEKTSWEVEVAKTTNGYSIYHTNGSKYLGLTSNGNSLYFNASFTASSYEWTLSAADGVQSVAYSSRYIESNLSTNKVACYAGGQDRMYLYKRIEEAASTTNYWSKPACTPKYAVNFTTPEGGTLVIKDGETAITSGDKFEATTALTVVVESDDNHTGGTIKVVKTGVNPEAEVTGDVLSGTTLTVPDYAVTVSVEFEEKQCDQLDAPTLNGAVAATFNGATITWNTVTNASSYKLNIVKHEGSVAVLTDEIIVAPAVSYEIASGLTINTQYDFTLMAVGTGDYCSMNPLLESSFTTTDYPDATVTLSVQDVTTDVTGNKVNDVITLPNEDDVTECNGRVFMGWDANAECAEAPTYAPGAEFTIIATTQTLYAVYAKASLDANADPVLSQTHNFDDEDWNAHGSTDPRTNYMLFGTNAYVESDAFDLSTLSKVIVYGGTCGGDSYNSLTIGDGTNTWKSVTVTGKSETGTNTYTDGTALSGTGKLRVTSTCGNGSTTGIRISKIEIFTFGTSYSNYSTTCLAPVATPVIEGVTASETYDVDKEITITCATEGASISYRINEGEWTAYTVPFTVSDEGDYTIETKAVKSGMEDSELASVSFSIVLPVPVTGVTLNITEKTLKVGNTLELTATIAPGSATNKNVTWETSDANIATVEDGVVTAVAEGTATITVKSVADPTKTATCTITVPKVVNFATGDWMLVTDVAELTEGSYVIIAAKDYNYAMVSYESDNNNCGRAGAEKENNVLTYNSNFAVFEIQNYVEEEVVVGKSFFDVNTETYLYSPSNNNYLKTKSTQDQTAAWNINITTSKTTIFNKQRTSYEIQYNANGMFSCYQSTQNAIALYKYYAPVPKVTYDKNTDDAVIGLPNVQRAELVGNENKAVIAAGPSRTGYDFIGWKDAEQNSYTVGTEYVFTADITLYAQWEAKPAYHVTYVATGNAPTDDTNYYEGDLVTLVSGNNLSNPGYVFDGWNDGENTYAAGYDEYEMPNNDVTFTAVWSRKSNQKWILVTDENDIKTDGTEYIIAGASSDVAMAGLSGKIYTYTSVDKNDNILTGSESMTKLTFETGSASGKWAIKNGTKYIASTTVKEMKEVADAFDWTITITNGVATISASVGSLKYNASQPRFTTYASGQQGVAIYEKVANLIVDDEQTKTAAQVNASDITVKEDGKLTINVDADDKRIGDITVEDGGELIVTGSKHIKANNVYLSATMAGGTSSQMSGTPANLDIDGDVFFDITLGANGTNQQWHAFTVPFPVDVMNGIYDLNNVKLDNEVNYAIMEYHGDLRAKGEYGWKKIRTTLVPGTFYIMATDGYRTTYRFKKKAGEPLVAANSKSLSEYPIEGNGEDGEDNGWNGVGNPTLMYGKVGYNVYVLNPNPLVYDYELKIANSTNFVVGTPFFIQAADEGTMSMTAIDGEKPYYAPTREKATEIMNVDVTFGNEVYTDHLYISASEDALNEYETGKDLVKMTMSNTPRVGRIFGNAYGHELTMVYAPLSNNQAVYDLSLYAPKAGTYSIDVPNAEDVTIYLTHEGSIIWNLTASAYELELPQGTTEGYGLKLVVKAPQTPTGVEDVQMNDVQCTKMIIDEKVFILRGGKMYDVTGKAVR